MISANDTTILAVLSRYPDMSVEEADGYIAKIEHEENVQICHAFLGRVNKEDLASDARRVFDEFYRWSADRTRRIRNENWNARQRSKETRMTLKFNELHEKGIISDQTLLLYGISGELPERDMYRTLSDEERESLWAEKMETRFGPNWRERFQNRRMVLPAFLNRRIELSRPNWLKEGF